MIGKAPNTITSSTKEEDYHDEACFFAKDLEEVLDSAAADLRITVCALMENDQLGPKLFSGTIKEFCEDMREPQGEVAKEWRIAEILRYKDSR